MQHIWFTKSLAWLTHSLQTAGLRRPEVDQYGNMKRVASRPKAARIFPQPLSEREVLLMGILSVWRANPLFHLKTITEGEVDEWVATTVKIWEAPMDLSVKSSNASSFKLLVEAAYDSSPSEMPEPYFSLMIRFIKTTL